MWWLDVLLVLVFLIGGRRGYRRGFVVSLTGLLALCVGFFLSAYLVFWRPIDGLLSSEGEAHPLRQGLLLIALWALFWLILRMLALLFRFSLRLTLLGGIDRALGALLGMLKWSFFVSVLIYIAHLFNPSWVTGTLCRSQVCLLLLHSVERLV